ncbi:MAG: hypothetical protein IJQ12_08230 [Lachnospiraceae bacterium]|nr:hypothetical protein [Lachnospiraceae bacterium]
MINFEEELRRYQPILEIEQAESAIRNQDLDDMADVALGIIMEAREEAQTSMRNPRQEAYQNIVQEIEVEDALL